MLFVHHGIVFTELREVLEHPLCTARFFFFTAALLTHCGGVEFSLGNDGDVFILEAAMQRRDPQHELGAAGIKVFPALTQFRFDGFASAKTLSSNEDTALKALNHRL